MWSHALRRRARSQGGFALLAVILVTLLTSVIVIALLSLSFTSSVFSTGQRERDRLHRAGNGAIDLAVDVLARQGKDVGRSLAVVTPKPGAPDPTVPICDLVQPRFDPDIGVAVGNSGDQLPTVTVDGVQVVLTCAAQPPALPDVAVALPDPDVPETFDVVGAACKVACGSRPTINFAQAFTAAQRNLLSPADFAAADAYAAAATLVHAGAGPLRFSSAVNVRGSAVAWRFDGFNTGLSSAQSFQQGLAGLPAKESAFVAPPGPACGAQSVDHRPISQALLVRSFIKERVTCGVTPQAPNLTDPGLRPTKVWSQTEITNKAISSLPSCSGSTNRDAVVFSPGAYSPAQVATMNNMFNRSIAACQGRVFLFKHGVYYFDADASKSGPSSGALEFNDESAAWVFGDPPVAGPRYWRASGNALSEPPLIQKVGGTIVNGAVVGGLFPGRQAPAPGSAPTAPCGIDERTSPSLGTGGYYSAAEGRVPTGVEITLSTATSFRHLAGRVAICDRREPGPNDALRSPSGSGGANPSSQATLPASNPEQDTTSYAPVAAVYQAPAALPVAISNQWQNVGPTSVQFTSGYQAGTPVSALAAKDGVVATVRASCSGTGTDFGPDLVNHDWRGPCSMTTPAVFSASFPGSFSTPLPSGDAPIEELFVTQNYRLQYATTNPTEEVIRITGTRIKGGSCEVVVDLPTPDSSGNVEQKVDLLASNRSSKPCKEAIADLADLTDATVQVTFRPAPLASRVFDVAGNGTTGGGNLVAYVSCARDFAVFSTPPPCTPPYPEFQIDRFAFSVAQAPPSGAPVSRFEVTTNLDPRASASDPKLASFNVFGRTVMAGADLTLNWNGAASGDPVFGGTTILNTLWSKGSRAADPQVVGAFQGQPGVVCCDRATASQRAIVLNAWVNVRKLQRQKRDANGNVVLDPGTNQPVVEDYLSGQLAATARVSLDDYSTAFSSSGQNGASDAPQVFDPGFDVKLERFQACALSRLPLNFQDVRQGSAGSGGTDGLDPDLPIAQRAGADPRCQTP